MMFETEDEVVREDPNQTWQVLQEETETGKAMPLRFTQGKGHVTT